MLTGVGKKSRIVTLALSAAVLVLSVYARETFLGASDARMMPGFFAMQVGVIAVFALVVYRLRAFPIRASLEAAGGWGSNLPRLAVALIPLLSAPAYLVTHDFIEMPATADGKEVHSAQWREADGRYFVQFNGGPEEEITQERFAELNGRLVGVFAHFWLLFSLASTSVAWAMFCWPGVDRLAVPVLAVREKKPWWDNARQTLSSNPFKKIWRAEPVRIPVSAMPEEALERLRSRTPRIALFRPFSEGCVGYVSRDSVRLRHYRPLNSSQLAPVLDARILSDASGHSLSGEYRVGWFARFFLSFWFGMITLFIPLFLIGSIASITAEGWTATAFAFAPLCLFAFGQFFLAAGQANWDADKSYIEAFVSRSLSA